MIHILLLILKILGFLILGILALIVLLALIFLISPVVYRIHVSRKDTLDSLEGSVRFHWLFRLISGEVRYEAGELSWRFRAAWKRFGSGDDDDASGKTEEAEEPEEKQPPQIPEKQQAASAVKEKEQVTVSKEKEESSVSEEEGKKAAALKEEPEKGAASKEKPEKIPVPKEKPKKSSSSAEKKKAPQEKRKSEKIYEKIQKFLEKIKYTFQKICDKIRALKQKKDALMEFIQDEVHQNAFRRGVKEIKRLLGFLKPDQADIEVEFGFADPAYTGYTLAAVSIFWPVIGEYTRIQPDFEHRVLRGRADVKGKIRAVYAVILAWNLVWDKNVRTTFKHVRKFIK